MSLRIILAVLGGIVAGYFFVPESILLNLDIIIDIGLCLLLFFVGIDIGRNKEVFNRIKEMGFKILLVPVMIIVGSLVGSIIAGFIIDLPVNESGAVGAGLGWYTLSSMMLANYSSELSTLAFLTNVVREIIGLITIPLIAKHIGFLEGIAPAGATAMDTSLPLISKSTDSKTAVVSFITGVILSTSVPFLVPLMIGI